MNASKILGGGEDSPKEGLMVGQPKGEGVVGNLDSASRVSGLVEGLLKLFEGGKAGTGELRVPFLP